MELKIKHEPAYVFKFPYAKSFSVSYAFTTFASAESFICKDNCKEVEKRVSANECKTDLDG